MAGMLVFATALAALVHFGSATAMGAVKLDNMTFDKMVSIPGFTWLVKFDKNYAYGDKEDEFKELCKLAYKVPDFSIGEIPVAEYGDKDNDDLRLRFELKVDDFPVYFLFKGSAESNIRYEGFSDPVASKPATWDDEEDGPWEPPMLSDITAENLAKWLRQQGVKFPSIGTIAELDEVVKAFLQNGFKDSFIKEAKSLAGGDHKEDPKAPVYIRIMEKVKERGVEYVGSETARVKKIMAGNLTPEKKAQLTEKLKILGVFDA